jgi:hypothetical protein
MSPIAKKFFTASVIYFVLGLLAQAVSIFDLWLGFNPLAYTAVSATTQILLIGWLTQLGLALIYNFWLLPVGARSGSFVFILFNLGLPLVIIGQPGLAVLGGVWVGLIAVLGGGCQLLAGSILLWEVLRLLKQLS